MKRTLWFVGREAISLLIKKKEKEKNKKEEEEEEKKKKEKEKQHLVLSKEAFVYLCSIIFLASGLLSWEWGSWIYFILPLKISRCFYFLPNIYIEK